MSGAPAIGGKTGKSLVLPLNLQNSRGRGNALVVLAFLGVRAMQVAPLYVIC